jgi:putative phosphoribosyl transferase
MKFTDTHAAGIALATELEGFRDQKDIVVIGVARGGLAVALEISNRLSLPLDIAMLRRLLMPRGPNDPVCAVNAAGTLYVDGEAAIHLDQDVDTVHKHVISEAIKGLSAEARVCRADRPPVHLAGRPILLVDNGIRTGSTLRVVVRALRTLGPPSVTIAVPVIDPAAIPTVRSFADDLIYLASPDPFGHVGLWYRSLVRPSDDQIRSMFMSSIAGRPWGEV